MAGVRMLHCSVKRRFILHCRNIPHYKKPYRNLKIPLVLHLRVLIEFSAKVG